MQEIISRRRTLGMSRQELAARAQVSQCALQQVESYALVDVGAYRKICRALEQAEAEVIERAIGMICMTKSLGGHES